MEDRKPPYIKDDIETIILPDDTLKETNNIATETPSDVQDVATEPRQSLTKNRVLWAAVVIMLLVNTVSIAWLLTHRSSGTTIVQLGEEGTKDATDTSATLSLDTKTKSVGVGTDKPQGLQIESSIGTNSRENANLRLGLLNGSPGVVFENAAGAQWQIAMAGDTLQYGKVGETLTNFGASVPQASTTLGIDAKSALILQASTIATPNNLAIDDATLFIDAVNHRLAVGSKNAQGYKLHVTGSTRITGALTVDDQVLVGGGSAAKPSYSFQGAPSSGLFASSGGVAITVGGVQVLRAQSGTVIVANMEADGFIRAGRAADNPSWQVKRITGTFGSSDIDVAHGLAASNRILLVDAWYLDNSGNVRSVVEYYNNSHVHLTNGTVGKPYRITIMYAADGAGW